MYITSFSYKSGVVLDLRYLTLVITKQHSFSLNYDYRVNEFENLNFVSFFRKERTMPGYIWDNYHIKSFTRVNFIDYLTLSSGKCAGLELEWLKCADRVGLMNSREKCKESFEDFQECSWRIKTVSLGTLLMTSKAWEVGFCHCKKITL